MNIPDIAPGAEIIFGGVMWSLVVTGLVTAFTKFVRPLTESQIQVSKGVLSALGYIVLVLLVNAPQYQNVFTAIVTTIMFFLTSSGIYDIGQKHFPSIQSNIDGKDKNMGA